MRLSTQLGLALLLPLAALAAEPVNVVPTPRSTLELQESKPPTDTLDRWHDWLYLTVQDFIERSQELRAETFLSDLERCLKPLGLCFQVPDLSVGKLIHCARLFGFLQIGHENAGS